MMAYIYPFYPAIREILRDSSWAFLAKKTNYSRFFARLPEMIVAYLNNPKKIGLLPEKMYVVEF